MNRRISGLILLLAIVCLAPLPVFAQVGTGTITGHVTDATGALVPNAQVVAVNAATQVRTTAATNSSGIYELPNLIPGTYSLEVLAKGFKKLVRTNILVQVADNIGLDLRLEVGAINETVTITAEAPQLRTEDAQTGEVFNEELLQTLVNPSRNPINLITLAGNVQGGGGGAGVPLGNGNTGAFYSPPNDTRINGGRLSSIDYIVDGISETGGFVHQVVNTTPNNEDVQEFKVITNGMSAEYGRLSGGAVELQTKSGSNAIHGQLFEYHQDQFFNANGWGNDDLCLFDKANSLPTTACRKSLFHQNDYGFAVGGPVVIPHVYNGRNKTFWFANAEWLHNQTPGGQQFGTTVSDAERNSIPNPYNNWQIANKVPCPAGTQAATPFAGAGFPYVNDTTDCADLTDIGNAPYSPTAGTGDGYGDSQTPYPYVALGDIYFAPDVNGNRVLAGGDGRHIPVSELDPAALHYIALQPHANIPPIYGTTGFNYMYRTATHTKQLKWDVRVDHAIDDKQHIYGHFTHDDETYLQGAAYPNYQQPGTNLKGGFQANVHYDYEISPTLILDLNAGGNYSPGVFGGLVQGPGASTSGWGFQPSVSSLIGTTMESLDQIRDESSQWGNGDVMGSSFLQGPTARSIATTTFQYSAALTKIVGRHTMKFGYDGRRYYDNFLFPAGAGGSDGFFITAFGTFQNLSEDNNIWSNTLGDANAMGAYFWGLDSWAHSSQATARELANNYYSGYMQDDFKASKKLTVNVGVRWEMQTPITERHDNLTVWDPLAPAPFTLPSSYNFQNAVLNATCTPISDIQIGGQSPTTCTAMTPQMEGMLTPPDWAVSGAFDPGAIVFVHSPEHRARTATPYHPWNFAPRVGFAYQAMKNTVVRGSFGIFYMPLGNGMTSYGDTPSVAYTTSANTGFGNNAYNTYIGQPGFQTLTNAYPVPSLELAVFGHNSRQANIETASNGSGSGGVIATAHMPHEMDWSFGIQHQFPRNWLVEVTYSGNHSGDLQGLLYPSHINKANWTGGPYAPAGATCNDGSGNYLPCVGSPTAYNALMLGWNSGGNQANYYVSSPVAGQFPSGTFTGGNGPVDASGNPQVPLADLLYQYPYYGPVNIEGANIARANFNSANLRVEKRLSEGLQLLFNYTYAKSLDNAGGPDQGSTPSNGGVGTAAKTFQGVDTIANVYGLSTYDQTHRLVATYNYQLPFGHGRKWMNSQTGIVGGLIEGGLGGWEITGDTTWNSGQPVGIGFLGTNIGQNDDLWYMYGSLAPGATLSALKGTAYGNPGSTMCEQFCQAAGQASKHPSAFNVNALAPAASTWYATASNQHAGDVGPMTYGTLPPIVGILRQPSSWGTDIAIMKRFPIVREGTYFQLRLEGQNIFNHPTLGGLDTNAYDATFGQVTTKNGSRVVVISGRFVF